MLNSVCHFFPSVVISEDESIAAQRLILKPISLDLTLTRSLSSWYHEVPDIDVVGKLHAVSVSDIVSSIIFIIIFSLYIYICNTFTLNAVPLLHIGHTPHHVSYAIP